MASKKLTPQEKALEVRKHTDIDLVLKTLKELYPDAHCELNHKNAYELLVATQLSAQCTDERVNKVTPLFFEKWPDAKSLSEAKTEDVEQVVHSTGFFRNKAHNLVSAAKILVEKHSGEVPNNMDSLVEIPGVARKTANVVLGTFYKVQEGVVVDTHVYRVTKRLGWHQEKSATNVEPILMELIHKDEWSNFGHRMVLFGRYHCKAKNPACKECPLLSICKEAEIG